MKYLTSLLIILSFSLCASTQENQNIEKLGSIYDSPGSALWPTVLKDSWLYLPQFRNGVKVIDVSSSAHPTEVGTFNVNDRAFDIAFFDTFAYIAAGQEGIIIAGASNPVELTRLGQYQLDSTTTSVEISGDVLFVENHRSGVLAFDLSNPIEPEILGGHEAQMPVELFVYGDIAFLLYYGSDSLKILDVSDPSEIELLCDMPRRCYGIDYFDGYLFRAEGNRGLAIYDLIEPQRPQEINRYDTDGFCSSCFYSDGLLYIADGPGGLSVLNVNNFEYLSLVGHCETEGASKLTVSPDSLIYLCDYTNLGIYRYTPEAGISDSPLIPHPSSFLLSSYPSPFNSSAVVSFQTPFAGEVRGALVGLDGRELREYWIPAFAGMRGTNHFTIDGTGLSAGTYWLKLDQNGRSAVTRMTLVK